MEIYKITNTINGKIYIGQSSKIDASYFGSGILILKAIKKYGKESFVKEIIEVCDTKEMTNEREIFWIKFYNSVNRNVGYNISDGGNGGNLGEAVNKKISESRKKSGYMIGNTLRKGKQAPNKGIPMSSSQRKKLTGPKTEEHKRKMSISRRLRPVKEILCINNGKIYTMSQAASDLNLTIPNIIEVLKGRAKTTKGYSFVYLNDQKLS